MCKEMIANFKGRQFEFFHVRQKIPGYTVGVHHRFAHAGVIVITGVSGKAKLWSMTEPGIKAIEKTK